MHRAAAGGPDDARMQVGGDVGYLRVGGFHLDDFRVLRRMHKLSELDAIFIVKGDERHNQIGAGLTALAALSMTVAAGRIVERKAAIDGIGRIDDESRTSATPSAS